MYMLYTKTLNTHAQIALDILADMFFNSRFDEKDIDIERKVILDEIDMCEDSPEGLVHDLLSESVWESNSLGFPILGTRESLSQIGQKEIKNYVKKNYLPQNTLVVIVGNFEHDYMEELVKEKFGGWKVPSTTRNMFKATQFIPCSKIKKKETEQVHICMAFEGIEYGNDDLYPLLAINNLLGGGMSSRLFQKVREEMGLAYSIYSYPSSYMNAGLFTVYAGMNPVHFQMVMELLIDEIRFLIKNGMSEEELEKSKEQLKGNYILASEDTGSRMSSIGKSGLLLDKTFSHDVILKKIDDISIERVKQVQKQVFDLNRVSFTAVGNIKCDINLSELKL